MLSRSQYTKKKIVKATEKKVFYNSVVSNARIAICSYAQIK